ncbi:hypothetical protein FV140_20325 [Paenarthrobacter ureafaciens]|nr:hypothetical protein FV140_20325 [Paenarthrobacter ureafaciens]
MKKISTLGWVSNPTHGAATARTGFHCPRNGFWRPVGGIGEPLFVFEGSLMPRTAATASNGTLWTPVPATPDSTRAQAAGTQGTDGRQLRRHDPQLCGRAPFCCPARRTPKPTARCPAPRAPKPAARRRTSNDERTGRFQGMRPVRCAEATSAVATSAEVTSPPPEGPSA